MYLYIYIFICIYIILCVIIIFYNLQKKRYHYISVSFCIIISLRNLTLQNDLGNDSDDPRSSEPRAALFAWFRVPGRAVSANKALKKNGSLEHGFDDSLRDATASQTLSGFTFKARRKDCTGENYGIPPMEKDNVSFLSKYLRIRCVWIRICYIFPCSV